MVSVDYILTDVRTKYNTHFADYMDKTQEYMANFAIVSHGFQAEIRRIVLTT